MAEDRFRDRLALVTGAGSGIGEAISRRLAERGARLVLCDIDPAGLGRVADALGEAVVGREAVDVGDAAAMSALATWVHTAHGTLDILVNNAGVAAIAPVFETPPADWEWMLRVNLLGVVHGCHVFGPAMVAGERRGHIVNIASSAGFGGIPVLSAYAATKAAVVSYSEAMRAEIPGRALGVSVICPGFVPTAIAEHGRFVDESMRAQAAKVLARKGRSADDVARAVIGAIERDRFLVPLYPEAWMALALRRLPSAVSRRLVPLLRSSQERRGG